MLAVPLLVVAALGGCGSSGTKKEVASAGGGPASSASAAPQDETELRRKFAQCVRAEGVDMPDAGPDGTIGLPAQKAGTKVSEANAKMAAALEKCREFLPNGGEPPKLTPEDIAKMRDLSKCIRENGVPDYPDPDPETGMIELSGAAGDGKLQKAFEKCKGVGPDRLPGVRIRK
jgi:hypothetical protein